MEKLLITPKNKSSLTFLQKLFADLDSIENVEVLDDGEVRDDVLLAKMKRNLKTGFTTRERVINALDKVISKSKRRLFT